LRSPSKEYVKRSGIKAGTSPSSSSPSAKLVDESREPNDPHGFSYAAQSRVKDRVSKSSSLQLCMQLNDLSPNFGCEPVDSSKNDSGNIWDYSDNEAAPASSCFLILEFCAFITTIALFPGDMSGFSPATCRWGKVSPATYRWGILAGEAS
ncbi:hypothetical protein Tco_0373143, partial [Tanacetum coccineum]